MSKVKTTIVSPSQFLDEEFKDPSRWYITDCMGDRVYYHCMARDQAQLWCNEEYGSGKYTIKTNKTMKPKGDITVRSTLNSFSRKGMKTKGN
jgi:hypothetical protein